MQNAKLNEEYVLVKKAASAMLSKSVSGDAKSSKSSDADGKQVSTSSPSPTAPLSSGYCLDLPDGVKDEALTAFRNEVLSKRNSVDSSSAGGMSDRISLSRKSDQGYVTFGGTPWWLTAVSGLTSAPTSLISIAEGSDYTNRIGRVIKILNSKIRLNLWADYPTGIQPGPAQFAISDVRVIVFLDRFPIIGTPTLAADAEPTTDFKAVLNTLGSTAAGPSATNGMLNTRAPFNLNTHGTRYHILHDEVYNIYKNGAVAAAYNSTVYPMIAASKVIDLDIPHHYKVEFYGTAGNALLTNGLYIYVLQNYPDGAVWQSGLNWNWMCTVKNDFEDC